MEVADDAWAALQCYFRVAEQSGKLNYFRC